MVGFANSFINIEIVNVNSDAIFSYTVKNNLSSTRGLFRDFGGAETFLFQVKFPNSKEFP